MRVSDDKVDQGTGDDQLYLCQVEGGDQVVFAKLGDQVPGGDKLYQCHVCHDQCLGVWAYLMHMDHHPVVTTLECMSCKK